MSFPTIHTALLSERQNTLLEEADALRRAKAAQAYRRAHGTRGGDGSPFRGVPGRLAAAWRRVVTSPRSGTEAAG
jgi:hypothetical protein